PKENWPGYVLGDKAIAYSAEPDLFFAIHGHNAAWPKKDEMPEETEATKNAVGWSISTEPDLRFVPQYVPNPKPTGKADQGVINETFLPYFVALNPAKQERKYVANCTQEGFSDGQEVKLFVQPDMSILFSMNAGVATSKGPGADRFKPAGGWSKGYVAESKI